MSTQPARGDNRHPGGKIPSEMDSGRLAAVLRAAAAPAHPEELAGEKAAMTAFREAAPSPPSLLRTVLAKVLTVKAVIVLAAAGSAGVVVAATGGVLPTPWSAGPPVEQSSTATPAPTSTDRTTEPGPPAPSITELCQRYASHEHPDNALADPAFRPLVAAARGKDKVTDYCAVHTSQPSKPGNNGKSGNNGKPDDSGKPANKSKPVKEPKQTAGNGHTVETNGPKKTGNNGQAKMTDN